MREHKTVYSIDIYLTPTQGLCNVQVHEVYMFCKKSVQGSIKQPLPCIQLILFDLQGKDYVVYKYMRFTCFVMCTCGVQLVYMWCTCGVHVVYKWCTCGVHVVYMWCTCGVHVVVSEFLNVRILGKCRLLLLLLKHPSHLLPLIKSCSSLPPTQMRNRQIRKTLNACRGGCLVYSTVISYLNLSNDCFGAS